MPHRILKPAAAARLRDAAMDTTPISGWTHNYYRYPARFSPNFAASVIESLSKPGDIILDPYMGGGTVVVEALAHGRIGVGNDLNALATFVAQVKTTLLSRVEIDSILRWAADTVPRLSYRTSALETAAYMQPEKMKNLNLLRARFIKKVVAAAIASISKLPAHNAQNFARCAVLRTAQWALDGRKKQTPVAEFRTALAQGCQDMLDQLSAFAARIREHRTYQAGPAGVLLHGDAARIAATPYFKAKKRRASLIVTSPPYPGVHVLYHRWQVDGRRESPAPYWIINGSDGQSASYYTFNDRRQTTSDPYFMTSLRTLQAIRQVIAPGGHMVQLVAFHEPETQLGRYLANMSAAGFEEMRLQHGESRDANRIWRSVPNRKWHAANRGASHSANEVLLVHRAA